MLYKILSVNIGTVVCHNYMVLCLAVQMYNELELCLYDNPNTFYDHGEIYGECCHHIVL